MGDTQIIEGYIDNLVYGDIFILFQMQLVHIGGVWDLLFMQHAHCLQSASYLPSTTTTPI